MENKNSKQLYGYYIRQRIVDLIAAAAWGHKQCWTNSWKRFGNFPQIPYRAQYNTGGLCVIVFRLFVYYLG